MLRPRILVPRAYRAPRCRPLLAGAASSQLDPAPSLDNESSLLIQDISHPVACVNKGFGVCRDISRYDGNRRDQLGKISLENWFVMSDPVAIFAHCVELAMELLPCPGVVRERAM